MENLNLFTSNDRDSIIKARKGESKFGEHIQLLPNLSNIYESLVNLDVKYVIFGIKDDVGVFANHGIPGTSKAWDVAVKFLLNIQSNQFTKPNKVLLLGHLDYTSNFQKLLETSKSSKKQIQKARTFVDEIDKDVSYLISCIIKAKKIPIVIGGGHNNSYGNIKGASLALNKKINVVNFDAHSDFRQEEGRHSGNGFSYAYAEGFLKNYFIFGLHENYTSEKLFKTINKLKDIQYITYDDIFINKKSDFESALEDANNHMSNKAFGIEVDCDAIENVPSSALTPSGFTILQARQFVNYFASQKNVTYLHISEAVPKKKSEVYVGKLISYLITDFLKANN
ncbi:formimidoylglutamase [Winogradskyella sp. DF17]|uniref:Formimidoylglutamase n=1 Tax=Winogradskyella pelagia TaxID=2819984 RepID=A0ABS3T2A2_9FLAO|nr:formimidoylglutamase [Winogradskyella sp. DF17]MBO3116857.1 formimidoylglutamase [Winogradskyella sp. DF17]